jgi:L-fucose isomerase-like protein
MPWATLAVIVSNRDFFPDSLVASGRQAVLSALKEANIEVIIPDEGTTNLGGVETYADAKRCAELLRDNRDRIDGVLVSLPNFGDERGVADALKLAGLNVPVLLHAFPDELDRMNVENRRDAFCGKISVANHFNQCGIPFTLTTKHVVSPDDASFREDLDRFVRVCKVVNGMRKARIGAVGARPNAFNTVRYSEKILEANGIGISTIDLSELFTAAESIPDTDPRVQDKVREITDYITTADVPADSLRKMARLGLAILDWTTENELDATAIQCWTSVQTNFGVNACTLMSMMSEKLMPSACEVDVTGAATMYAMGLAAGTPAALVDWNNNYGGQADKCVMFHCGNWAKCFLPGARMSVAPILGSVVGTDRTYGAMEGRTDSGPMTFARLTTDDTKGAIRAYVGQGRLTDDPLETFGSRAVAEIPDMDGLLRHVCREGFEHHVAVSLSQTADVLNEAFTRYMRWDTYYHRPE